MSDWRYIYLGSATGRKLAAMGFDVVNRSGMPCSPVCHRDGCVIRSTKKGRSSTLVCFADGTVSTVSPRRLKDKYERKQQED